MANGGGVTFIPPPDIGGVLAQLGTALGGIVNPKGRELEKQAKFIQENPEVARYIAESQRRMIDEGKPVEEQVKVLKMWNLDPKWGETLVNAFPRSPEEEKAALERKHGLPALDVQVRGMTDRLKADELQVLIREDAGAANAALQLARMAGEGFDLRDKEAFRSRENILHEARLSNQIRGEEFTAAMAGDEETLKKLQTRLGISDAEWAIETGPARRKIEGIDLDTALSDANFNFNTLDERQHNALAKYEIERGLNEVQYRRVMDFVNYVDNLAAEQPEMAELELAAIMNPTFFNWLVSGRLQSESNSLGMDTKEYLGMFLDMQREMREQVAQVNKLQQEGEPEALRAASSQLGVMGQVMMMYFPEWESIMTEEDKKFFGGFGVKVTRLAPQTIVGYNAMSIEVAGQRFHEAFDLEGETGFNEALVEFQTLPIFQNLTPPQRAEVLFNADKMLQGLRVEIEENETFTEPVLRATPAAEMTQEQLVKAKGLEIIDEMTYRRYRKTKADQALGLIVGGLNAILPTGSATRKPKKKEEK